MSKVLCPNCGKPAEMAGVKCVGFIDGFPTHGENACSHCWMMMRGNCEPQWYALTGVNGRVIDYISWHEYINWLPEEVLSWKLGAEISYKMKLEGVVL